MLDLGAARSGLLAKFDPEVTIAARVQFRLDVRTIRGVAPRDDLDPVMGCPQFLDPMYPEATRQALQRLWSAALLDPRSAARELGPGIARQAVRAFRPARTAAG